MTWCSCQINIYIITLHDNRYLSDDAGGLSDVSTESCNCNLCPHEVDSLIKGVAICCPPEREASKSRNCCLRHQQLHGLMKSLSVQLDRPFVLKCVFHGTNDPAETTHHRPTGSTDTNDDLSPERVKLHRCPVSFLSNQNLDCICALCITG